VNLRRRQSLRRIVWPTAFLVSPIPLFWPCASPRSFLNAGFRLAGGPIVGGPSGSMGLPDLAVAARAALFRTSVRPHRAATLQGLWAQILALQDTGNRSPSIGLEVTDPYRPDRPRRNREGPICGTKRRPPKDGFRGVSFPCLAPRCTLLRSRWCPSGVNIALVSA
jgi:hypothetical protein